MSDLKNAKDALVASLFELAKAAQDAASATVDFYKVATNDGSSGAALTQIANGLSNISNKSAIISSALNEEAKTEEDGSSKKEHEVESKKKRRKVEKDPNAPKKPLTIFFAYSFHTRDEIRQERQSKGLPPLSAIEMNDIIKDRWTSITPEEKAKWQNKYQDELKEYNVLKDAYKAEKALPSGEVSATSVSKPAGGDIPEAPATPELKKIKSEIKKKKSEKKSDDSEKSEKSEKSDRSEKKSKKSKKSSSQSKE